MTLTGYLVNTKEGLAGEPGLFYNYILAGNGLFVKAHSPLLEATVYVADAEVRGIPALEPGLELCHGKIPHYLYDLALSIFYTNPCQERYLAVTWEGEYCLRIPAQETTASSVKYETIEGTIMDIHSHGHISGRFSWTDDKDEQGFHLYMVVGRLDALLPEVDLRVGVYGYFDPIMTEDVFT